MSAICAVRSEAAGVTDACFRFSKHNERFQTLIRAADEEPELVRKVLALSEPYDTTLEPAGGSVRVVLA